MGKVGLYNFSQLGEARKVRTCVITATSGSIYLWLNRIIVQFLPSIDLSLPFSHSPPSGISIIKHT